MLNMFLFNYEPYRFKKIIFKNLSPTKTLISLDFKTYNTLCRSYLRFFICLYLTSLSKHTPTNLNKLHQPSPLGYQRSNLTRKDISLLNS